MQPLVSFDDDKWTARMKKAFKGLRSPKDSGEYKSAVMYFERAFGPSFAALTVCIMVFILLLTFVATQALTPEAEIEVQVVEAETVDLDFDEPDLPEPEPLDPTEMVDDRIAPPETASTFADIEELSTGSADNADAPQIHDTPLITSSPVILQGLYGSRTAEGRAGAVNRFGGSGATESAVRNALRWLKENQDADGSWRRASTVEHVAMTGLAVLTYLAHGVTPEHEEFGDTLRKALQYLVSVQRRDGLFAGGNGYTHGIVAYAISEAYAMTRIMDLRDAMEKSIKVIINGQQEGGGFDYNFAKGTRWDTSVAGWMVQAMKAAHMAGVEIEGLEEAMDKSARFMSEDAWTRHNNMFLYGPSRGAGTWNMTGIGVLSMQLLGRLRDPSVHLGLASLAERNVVWNPDGGNHIYGWYYVTQAFFHQGGSYWERWNNMFAPQLVKAQHEDGHWTGGHRGGPVYTTTLNALMLQVYYRYLPTFQEPEERDTGHRVDSSHDVVIEVY